MLTRNQTFHVSGRGTFRLLVTVELCDLFNANPLGSRQVVRKGQKVQDNLKLTSHMCLPQKADAGKMLRRLVRIARKWLDQLQRTFCETHAAYPAVLPFLTSKSTTTQTSP